LRATVDVVRRALESAGVEFIDENGGGPDRAVSDVVRRTDREMYSIAALIETRMITWAIRAISK
jgi:hypothetical protein